MFRHVSSSPALLLDFLAPSFARSLTRQALPFPLQASSSSALFAKLKSTVHSIQSPSPHFNSQLDPTKVHLFNKTIHGIRKALRDDNNAAVLRHWHSLNKQKLLPLLSHAQLVPLSALMTQSFLSDRRRTQPQMLKLVENVALLAARGDSFDALNALAWYYIGQQEPQAVLDLYRRFMTLVGDKDLSFSKATDVFNEQPEEVCMGDEEGAKETLATDTELRFSQVDVCPGRAQLLLAAVTAYAIQDSFSDALKLYLGTIVRLPPPSDANLQSAFGGHPHLQTKMKDYISRLSIAKLVSRPGSFSRQVTNFGDTQATNMLEKLYKSLMDGLSGEAPFLVAGPSLVTDTKPIAMTNIGWTSLLAAFLKCNRKDLAGKLWDDMTALGVPPGVSLWTALIDAYGGIRAADDALNAWKMMLSQGIQPDALAYRAIISAMFRGRKPDQALQIFREYQTVPTNWSSPHHLSVCNTTLHGLCATDRVSQAEGLREELAKSGLKLDLITFNTFVSYYGRRGQFKAVATVLRDMKDAGVEGDVFTFTTILSALLKAGKMNASDLVLELMDKQGVKRNVAFYTALIDHQLREGGRRNFEAAMRMLRKMEQDPENPPNEITYTSILTGLYRLSWMLPDELERWHGEIVERIRSRGLVFGLPTYHLLLKSCLVYPHEDGIRQALAYFEEMKEREIPIINTTWYILLAGLLTRGEWEAADRLVGEMYISGIHPTGSLLRLVHKINNRIVDEEGDIYTAL